MRKATNRTVLRRILDYFWGQPLFLHIVCRPQNHLCPWNGMLIYTYEAQHLDIPSRAREGLECFVPS
jgi:hypothetical protein